MGKFFNPEEIKTVIGAQSRQIEKVLSSPEAVKDPDKALKAVELLEKLKARNNKAYYLRNKLNN